MSLSLSTPASRRSAFTLIELLVVIAIIAILSSMLFPSFARAREGARRASCSSNMKQLGLGIMQYTQDYDERLPNVWVGSDGNGQNGGWVAYQTCGLAGTPAVFTVGQSSLQPYLKSVQIFVCPSDSEGQRSGNSYAMNECASVAGTGVNGFHAGKSIVAFDESTKWALLTEESTIKNSTDDGYQLIPDANTVSDRHLSGSNVAYMDGHVKWARVDRMKIDRIWTGGQGNSCP